MTRGEQKENNAMKMSHLVGPCMIAVMFDRAMKVLTSQRAQNQLTDVKIARPLLQQIRFLSETYLDARPTYTTPHITYHIDKLSSDTRVRSATCPRRKFPGQSPRIPSTISHTT
jgi:hypothetical protein